MKIVMLTNENFESEVLKSEKPVLVDFWAPWCGPCKMIEPTIEEVAEEATDCKVAKVNIEEQSEIAQKFGIMHVPTLLFFKGGKVMEQMIGVKDKETIKQALEKLK